ncbi:Conserved_hypothetical protein [Hexamita inflata]|uniref:HTH myb-type domain-containing protein n=1 Tax=Hexamita inflata TaxID=28002 RepID=A0AA86U9X1_9EUKA|nr:Conserved hypothetical protein [Hexamita inflata]
MDSIALTNEQHKIVIDGFVEMVNKCFNRNFTEIIDAIKYYEIKMLVQSPISNGNESKVDQISNVTFETVANNTNDSAYSGHTTGDEEELRSIFVIHKRERKPEAFSWSSQLHNRFVLVVMALGVKDCKPKQVLELFGDFNGVTKSVIGSHLQKVRKMILKEQKLKQLTQVENWMAPKTVHDDRLASIVQKWKEPNFVGFSNKQLNNIVMEK